MENSFTEQKKEKSYKIINSILVFLFLCVFIGLYFFLIPAFLQLLVLSVMGLSGGGFILTLILPALFIAIPLILLVRIGGIIFKKRRFKGLLIELVLPLLIVIAITPIVLKIKNTQQVNLKNELITKSKNIQVIPQKICYLYNANATGNFVGNASDIIRWTGKIKAPEAVIYMMSCLGPLNYICDNGWMYIDNKRITNNYSFDGSSHEFRIDFPFDVKRDFNGGSPIGNKINVNKKFGTTFASAASLTDLFGSSKTQFYNAPLPENFENNVIDYYVNKKSEPYCVDLNQK